MMVAVPLFQHSPIFGQNDSSQTVLSLLLRTLRRNSANSLPVGSSALSHSGLRPGRSSAPARDFTPSFTALKPCSVRYLVPLSILRLPVANALLAPVEIRSGGDGFWHAGCHTRKIRGKKKPDRSRAIQGEDCLAYMNAVSINTQAVFHVALNAIATN